MATGPTGVVRREHARLSLNPTAPAAIAALVSGRVGRDDRIGC